MAIEDERELGLLPSAPDTLLVSRYLTRLNLRGYHNAHSYGSTFDSYLETVWWFEAHGFAEKLVLNGFAMYINEPAAQITFGVLASAVLVMVQVHVNPYMERDVGALANLLGVATFLLLLVGAHVALVGDGEWTTDAVAVQQSIIACAGFCVVAGCLIIVRDTIRNVLRMRDAHIKEWERQNGTRASSSSTTTGSRGMGLLRRIAGVAGGNAPPEPQAVSAQRTGRKWSAAATVAFNAGSWVVRQAAGADPTAPISAQVVTCLRRELQRAFGSDLLGYVTASQVVERALAQRQTRAAAPTMPTGDHLAAARVCLAAVKATTTSTLPDLPMPMPELAWRALVPGHKRLSVLVSVCLCRSVCVHAL